MAYNNVNSNNTSSSSSSLLSSIHNYADDDNADEELIKNFLLLTSPPKKKSKISNNNELAAVTAANINVKTTTTTTLPPSSFELNLFIVKSIFKTTQITNTIELKLLNLNQNTEIKCYLYDSWINCLIEVDYIVNILSELENDGNYHIRDDNNSFIIVNPHVILSGTAILASLSCLRKSILSWKFRDPNGGNSHMLLGNLLHMLFQDAIKNLKFNKSDLKIILTELIKRKVIVNQVFESNISEEHLVIEAISYLDSIENWLREYVKVKPTLLDKQNITNKGKFNSNNNNSQNNKKGLNFQILNVCDIEESIWSPKFGIKGKLDLTLQIEKHNEISNKKLSTIQLDTIPVELKSGRSTFSVEHEGQVMLYALLNKEKRKTSDYGLLLYLKDAKMKFIKATQNNLKGLIQLRNDLVYYISSNGLSELKNEERYCTKCSFLTICSLFNDKSANPRSEIVYETCIDLYSKSILHLKDSHKKYFFKWYHMLDLEFQNEKQFDAGDFIWNKSTTELEAIGYTVSNLRLVPSMETKTDSNSSEDEIKMFLPFEFRRDNNNNLSNCQLKENDMILLSIQNENQIGISQGFIKSITNQQCSYVLLLDKNLDIKNNKYNIFRIDKINYRSSICSNYTNLLKLMEPTEHSAKLREFIIDRKKPSFEVVLPKNDILKTKSFLKHLNQNQQLAIIKVLMAHNYLLIKGYPGTGKTSTIAALIAVLVKLGKKVLFTSYTNSAVDNLLLKLVKEFDVDFTRIGSYERIHPEIRKYESSVLTAKIDNVADLKTFYDGKPLIATTCSSMTNSVFNRIEFDYCIVDEASQVLQTMCLGPLLVSKKFVLVGDAEQLPPVIKNKDARLEGMGISLFEHLDLSENFTELFNQYRMNSDIMNLANEISYNGKLKCISDEVANKKIKFNEKNHSLNDDLLDKLVSNSVLFLDTTNLIKLNDSEAGQNEKLYKNFNPIESDIVIALCQMFIKNTDCTKVQNIGVIAPYNDQVKYLQNKLKNEKDLKEIEVNTVDQFQGRDKRVIILSFTNSILNNEPTKEFEILNDKRRLTVALTRAKEKLILIGSTKVLVKYKPIESLINSVHQNKNIYELTSLDEILNLTKY